MDERKWFVIKMPGEKAEIIDAEGQDLSLDGIRTLIGAGTVCGIEPEGLPEGCHGFADDLGLFDNWNTSPNIVRGDGEPDCVNGPVLFLGLDEESGDSVPMPLGDAKACAEWLDAHQADKNAYLAWMESHPGLLGAL